MTVWPDSEWERSEPSDCRMVPKPLTALEKVVSDEGMHTALVVSRGRVIFEYFKPGIDVDTPLEMFSCTKSVLSFLIGLAIEQGHIRGMNQFLSDFIPEFLQHDGDPRRQDVTIGHLLTHTSGLDWPEWREWEFTIPTEPEDDYLDFILRRPMQCEPGTQFNYSSGGSHLLSAVITQATGMSAYDYARSNLFDPIGIGDVIWPTDIRGISNGGSGIQLTARDSARFGYLCLREGRWNGEHIVPGKWVERATREQCEGHPWFGQYGLHWWVKNMASVRVCFAMGFGGQYIFVAPDYDVVAVFAGWVPGADGLKPMTYFEEFVLASANRA